MKKNYFVSTLILFLSAVAYGSYKIHPEVQRYIQDHKQELTRIDQELEVRKSRDYSNKKLGSVSPTDLFIVNGQEVNINSLRNWHLKGPEQHLEVLDKTTGETISYPLEGINLEKAAKLLTLNKSFSGFHPVVVAITDGGVNMFHEAIAPYQWVNEAEYFDGKDEDNNKFVDDRFGWDFVSAKVNGDSLEISRLYHQCQDGLTPLNNGEPVNCDEIRAAFAEEKSGCEDDVRFYNKIVRLADAVSKTYGLNWSGRGGLISQYRQKYSESILDAAKVQEIKEELRVKMVNELIPFQASASTTSYEILKSGPLYSVWKAEGEVTATSDKALLDFLISRLIRYDYFFWEHEAFWSSYDCKYRFGPDYVKKSVAGYSPENPQSSYGTPSGIGPRPDHGTHVAGIVIGVVEAALGKEAVKKALRIMPLRVTPDGDERDHDVANAVVYGVKNGAHVFNMSFGKDYSQYKDYVDQAFAFAEKRGVAITMSAGNASREITKANDFPNAYYRLDHGRKFNNVLVIGASNFVKKPILAKDIDPAYQKITLGGYASIWAGFSNYSKTDVDLFSPGTFIYSSYSEDATQNNRYAFLQGTSMASPVAVGVQALILTQFPALKHKANELRNIMLRSTRPYDVNVKIPSQKDPVPFASLSQTGGVIDAYLALCEASKWSKAHHGHQLKGCDI